MAKVFIVSGPSGSGKSTITRYVSEKLNIPLMISATTRLPRQGEVDKKDYFFLSKEEFERKIEEGDLLEYEKIHDNYYGTLKSEVDNALKTNNCIILEIDAKGTMQLLMKYDYDFVLVFCKTKDISELQKRIESRGKLPEDNLNKRLDRAKMELEYENYYDYTIVNNVFEDACNEFIDIIERNSGERYER